MYRKQFDLYRNKDMLSVSKRYAQHLVCRQSLAEFFARRRKIGKIRFLRRRVRRRKHISPCQCASCLLSADSECAQQGASPVGKVRWTLSTACMLGVSKRYAQHVDQTFTGTPAARSSPRRRVMSRKKTAPSMPSIIPASMLAGLSSMKKHSDGSSPNSPNSVS